jgi:hypothetical protein
MPLTSPVATRAPLGGERAFAERDAEPPPPEPPETPSASQAAAEAVIARLENILSEPEPAPGSAAAPDAQPAETPASASVGVANSSSPASSGVVVDPAVVLSIMPKRPRKSVPPLLLAGLGVIGVALFIVAALWGFQPAFAQALGVPAPWPGLVVGGMGLICFSIAVYFLLDRLGLPPERRR